MKRRPYIIAELSGNHNGDIHRALKLMEEAKAAGADAIKLQTYTADTITIKSDRNEFQVKGGLWDNSTLYELYQKAHTPWEWHQTLFEKGKALDIPVFSTPYDNSAVDFLESFNPPFYKIASFELVHHPLIAYIARLNKPIIMSTGMASLQEIEEAVSVALSNGCSNLTLLHCVSEYPAPIESCNLAILSDLQTRFPQCQIGLSDHTLGVTVAIAAVVLGATVIEKHLTLSRSEGGVDAAFSLEPHELKQLCDETANAVKAMGGINYERSFAEQGNKQFRQSIYAIKAIKKGEVFTEKNIKVIRPGYGIHPKYFPSLLGKTASQDIQRADPIRFSHCNETEKTLLRTCCDN